MPRRRRKKGNNEGSVYFDRDANRWIVKVSVPTDPADPSSKKRTIKRKVRTEDEANVLRADLLAKIAKGDFAELLPRSQSGNTARRAVAALPAEPTVGDFWDYWRDTVLPTEVIKDDIREVTRDHYVRIMRLYVIRGEGEGRNAGYGLERDLPLRELTADHVDAILRELRSPDGAAVSAATARHAVVALKKMLGVAAKRGYISAETVADIKPPTVPRGRRGRSLTEAQAVAVLEKVLSSDYVGRGAAILQLLGGVRRSEAVAARWSDLDGLTVPNGAHLFITESVSATDGGKLVFGPPKTARGRRTVALPEQARLALLRLRKQRPETVFVAQASRGATDPVWPNNYSRWLRGIYESVGAAGNSHAMRHAYAINALRAGVPMATISRMLGHSSYAITADIYMDIVDRDLRGAADAIAEVYALPMPTVPEVEAPAVS